LEWNAVIENEETQHNPSYRWVIAAVCFLMMFVTMGFGNSPTNVGCWVCSDWPWEKN
jgi:hypothetical protein